VAISFFKSVIRAERSGGFGLEWCISVACSTSVSIALDVDGREGTVRDAIAVLICSIVVAIIVLSKMISVLIDSSAVA